jgi:hypothetical protein
MGATCSNCGGSQFTDMEHNYYGMCWYFTCADCGSTLKVNEAESE